MQVGGSYESVVGSRIMLGEVVTKVGASGFSVHEELHLAFPILDPIEARVDSFGALLFNGVVSKAFGGGVVTKDRSCWLGIPQFSQGCANRYGLLPIDKSISNFGFSRGGHDVANDIGDGIDGSVEGRVGGWRVLRLRVALTEEVLATVTAAGVGFQEVGGVAVHMEDHVASNIANSGVRVQGGIIKQPYDFLIGGSGGFGFLRGNGAKGNEHDGVNGDGVVDQGSDYLLDKGD